MKAKEGEDGRSFIRDVPTLAPFLFAVGLSTTLAFRHQFHQIQKSLDLSSLREKKLTFCLQQVKSSLMNYLSNGATGRGMSKSTGIHIEHLSLRHHTPCTDTTKVLSPKST